MPKQIRYLLRALLLLPLLLASCSDYNRVLKSKDIDEKFEYAKMYYENGKYVKAATLLSDVVPIYRGTEQAEEAVYLLAMSHFKMKNYIDANGNDAETYFHRYLSNFPRGSKAEECRFNIAYCNYASSPDARLDQPETRQAIRGFDTFIELYPQSPLADSALVMRFEMSDKLCYKELLSAQLYLNLGSYMGNNYEAAVITARNAQNDYPYSKYREDLAYVIFKARYEAAVNSVEEKRQERLREAYDEYYTFVNEFPEGKYNQEVERAFARIRKQLEQLED